MKSVGFAEQHVVPIYSREVPRRLLGTRPEAVICPPTANIALHVKSAVKHSRGNH